MLVFHQNTIRCMESTGNELVKYCVVLVKPVGSYFVGRFCKKCKVINLVTRPFPVDSV